MAMCKSIKPMAQMLLLLLAIHMHILTVGSTTETSASFAKHSSVTVNKPSSKIDFIVWRRELRGGGGGGGRGGRGGGGGGRSGTGGTSSGNCLKHYGLSKSLLFIGILSYLLGVW